MTTVCTQFLQTTLNFQTFHHIVKFESVQNVRMFVYFFGLTIAISVLHKLHSINCIQNIVLVRMKQATLFKFGLTKSIEHRGNSVQLSGPSFTEVKRGIYSCICQKTLQNKSWINYAQSLV